MPFRAQKSLVTFDEHSIRREIDSGSVVDLHGLWSVFHQCASAMGDEGKRLENLSWRVFSREAFCCAPNLPLSQPCDRKRNSPTPDQLPELSTSVDSNSSVEYSRRQELFPSSARPELFRKVSVESGARREKHITPIDLEKIVVSIKAKKELAPLSPLPPGLVPAEPAVMPLDHEVNPPELNLHKDSIHAALPPATTISQSHLDSSTSTVATQDGFAEMSPPLAGSESTNTEISTTSIVRGFSKEHISCSHRSYSQLMPTPTPSGSILKGSLAHRAQAALPKKMPTKGATFQLGGSSGEGDSSFEGSYLYMQGKPSALSNHLRNTKKTTCFNDHVSTLESKSRAFQDAAVFDESDEEEDEQSSSAIEEDDVEEDWEDDDEQSMASSVNEKEMFQRVDSKPNLVSRRSLITSMMHEKDRASAMQNAASRSSPAIRRSRTSSPNGPINSSPPTSIAQGIEASRARPIIMTTSNTHPPALSPRTTRRNMLSTELTESLRKHLLWDRQVNRQATNAALKRRHTAQDMTKLQHFPGENQPKPFMTQKLPQSVKNSWNNYFDGGLQEYHSKGW